MTNHYPQTLRVEFKPTRTEIKTEEDFLGLLAEFDRDYHKLIADLLPTEIHYGSTPISNASDNDTFKSTLERIVDCPTPNNFILKVNITPSTDRMVVLCSEVQYGGTWVVREAVNQFNAIDRSLPCNSCTRYHEAGIIPSRGGMDPYGDTESHPARCDLGSGVTYLHQPTCPVHDPVLKNEKGTLARTASELVKEYLSKRVTL